MSEEILKQPNPGTYFPKQALIVYATSPADEESQPRYYIEISDIMLDAGKAFIGAGKPVTRATLQTMMDVIADTDKKTFHSVTNTIPTNLLILDQRAGRNVIAWWRPAVRQTIIIRQKTSITNWVPALVFIVKNQKLTVAALKTNTKPRINNRLYHAPFFNVYNDLSVCLGSVVLPKEGGDITELMLEWEKVFWLSEFTENVTGAYSKTDLTAWWRKRRRGRFSSKKLKLSNQSLKSLCEVL